jgi:hypothetical protein
MARKTLVINKTAADMLKASAPVPSTPADIQTLIAQACAAAVAQAMASMGKAPATTAPVVQTVGGLTVIQGSHGLYLGSADGKTGIANKSAMLFKGKTLAQVQEIVAWAEAEDARRSKAAEPVKAAKKAEAIAKAQARLAALQAK